MTADIEVAPQAKAPGGVISRRPGEPLPPRPARRQRDAILIVILLAAAARSARQAKVAGTVNSSGLDEPPPWRPVSRQRVAILIVVMLAGVAELVPVALSVITLAAIRDVVRDSQIIPRTLSWYFGPVSTWHIRRLKRRYVRQHMLDAPTGLGISVPAGNPISKAARTTDHESQMRPDEPWSPGAGRPGWRGSPATTAAGRGRARGCPRERVHAGGRIRDRSAGQPAGAAPLRTSATDLDGSGGGEVPMTTRRADRDPRPLAGAMRHAAQAGDWPLAASMLMPRRAVRGLTREGPGMGLGAAG